MKFSRGRLAFAFILTLLTLSVLTLVYWDFVRDALIVPIYYLLWLGRLILSSIPQGAFIGLLVVISLLVGIRTLSDVRDKPAVTILARNPQQVESRYQYWSHLCASLNAGRFSQTRFMSESRKLLFSVLAHEHSLNIVEVEAMVKNKTFAIPAEIEKLLLQREVQDVEPSPSVDQSVLARLKRRFSKVESPRNSQIDRLIVEITDFLEEHLEVTRDSNQLKF